MRGLPEKCYSIPQTFKIQNTTVHLLNQWDSNLRWILAKHVKCHRVFIFTTFGKLKTRRQEICQEDKKDEDKSIRRMKHI